MTLKETSERVTHLCDDLLGEEVRLLEDLDAHGAVLARHDHLRQGLELRRHQPQHIALEVRQDVVQQQADVVCELLEAVLEPFVRLRLLLSG